MPKGKGLFDPKAIERTMVQVPAPPDLRLGSTWPPAELHPGHAGWRVGLRGRGRALRPPRLLLRRPRRPPGGGARRDLALAEIKRSSSGDQAEIRRRSRGDVIAISVAGESYSEARREGGGKMRSAVAKAPEPTGAPADGCTALPSSVSAPRVFSCSVRAAHGHAVQ